MRYVIGWLMVGAWPASAETNEVASAAPVAASWFDPDSTVFALSVVFILVFILTFYVGVLYFRERRRLRAAAQSVVEAGLPVLTGVSSEQLPMEVWQQRALLAEALAGNQALLLREKLMPELTEFVKQSLVQGLAAQRDALLAMQQQALQSLVEFEVRLTALQAPMQERIRAYENRIAELERETSVQGAEMRELTRTILQLMRKKLDEEQAHPLDTLS